MNSVSSFILGLSLAFLAAEVLAGCQSSQTSIDIERKDAEQRAAQNADTATVRVTSAILRKQICIPGELAAFRDVAVYPKVQGFVREINVDRGSTVRQGQTLVEIDAPELHAQYGEAEGMLEAARSALLEMQSKIERSLAEQREAEAKLASDEAVQKRIQSAAKTPGAVAETDLDEAQQKVAGGRARVQALAQAVEAARSQLKSEQAKVKASQNALSSVRQIKDYLTIKAPFDGVVTERNVHEGSLVSSSSSTSKPMLRIQQTSSLRLLMPVPESAISGMSVGMPMTFTVPAFTGKIFTATLKRLGHALDTKTRSMIVEADVDNSRGELEPGMYPEVVWELKRPYQTLFVPASAITSNADATFVIRIRNGIANRVVVTRGQTMADLVEVVGALHAGDEVALKASEELKDGMKISPRLTALDSLNSRSKQED
jgi:RND family efflux transporter MFP subunit